MSVTAPHQITDPGVLRTELDDLAVRFGDPEGGHAYEDQLMIAVLRGIATGKVRQPAHLARLMADARDAYTGVRWYA